MYCDTTSSSAFDSLEVAAVMTMPLPYLSSVPFLYFCNTAIRSGFFIPAICPVALSADVLPSFP